MIPDCDGRSDGQTDGQTESIIANTALCIARAMLTRCKNDTFASVVPLVPGHFPRCPSGVGAYDYCGIFFFMK